MLNQYELRSVQYFTTPNGTIIHIFSDGLSRFVQFKRLYQALGYSKSITPRSTIALVLKNQRFALLTKKMAGISSPAQALPLEQVIPLLESFCRASLLADNSNPGIKTQTDNARMEAQCLIELFNREVFGKPDTVTIKPIETPVANPKEDTKMEIFKPTNTPAQGTIPVVTIADIDDISARADATAKVFGVSKADALRAVTKLKAEEINRDLAPLLELLG